MRYEVLVCALLASCASSPRVATGESNQRFSYDARDIDYKLVLPEGYADDALRRWPLLVFLHGAGERGNDVERVAIHGPVKRARTTAMPFVIVAPLCPKGRAWRNDELVALLDECVKRYRIDEDRVLLTGLSMGGYGTWSLGTTYPERFAAIVPICGGGETLTMRMHDEARKKSLRALGIWAFHGADDRVVAPEESKRMVRMLERLGARPKLTIYAGVGHGSWKPAYADEALWTWLEEQRR